MTSKLSSHQTSFLRILACEHELGNTGLALANLSYLHGRTYHSLIRRGLATIQSTTSKYGTYPSVCITPEGIEALIALGIR